MSGEQPQTVTTTTAAAHREPNPILRALRIPFLPLLWLVKPLVFRVGERQGTQVVTFTSYSGLVYCWPIIAVGFLNYFLFWANAAPATLGWVWLLTILGILIVLGADINRTAAFVWILALVLLVVLGLYVNEKWEIPVLNTIYNHFIRLNVRLDPGTARALSELLLVVFVFVILYALLDGRHEISSREIMHRRFLRASESWPLTVNRVRMDWPDIMEMVVLFGAGHIVIIDQDRKEVLRIPHIPFLWFFRHEVDTVLEVMATTEVSPAAMKTS